MQKVQGIQVPLINAMFFTAQAYFSTGGDTTSTLVVSKVTAIKITMFSIRQVCQPKFLEIGLDYQHTAPSTCWLLHHREISGRHMW